MTKPSLSKTPFRFLLILALASLAAGGAWASTRGNLFLIGGGKRTEPLMRKYIELAGGPQALILIVPTASELKDTGEVYIREFAGYGCPNVKELKIWEKADAEKGEWEALVPRAGGIFFAGGDQRRIVDACLGTPFLAAVRKAYERGAAIGGTSAGTACMSPLMLTGDGDDKTIRAGAMQLVEGLGLFPGVILDQHFIVRGRENRLFAVVAEHPRLIGLGVDEATAVWRHPDGLVEIEGETAVMVVDARRARITKSPGGTLGIRDLRVHVLLPGETVRLEK